MSDDTPTQRYPEGFTPPNGANRSSDNADRAGGANPEPGATELPTERFPVDPVADAPAAPAAYPAPAVPPPSAPPPPPRENSRQRGLIIGLAIAAGVLLLALVGLLIWLGVTNAGPAAEPTATETSASPEPTPDETPSETPSPEPTETEAPPPPAPAIAAFTASAASVDCTASEGSAVDVTFEWQATGTRLWFGVGTADAQADAFGEFPLVHTLDFAYQCGQPEAQQRYTITVQKDDGSTESRTLVVRET